MSDETRRLPKRPYGPPRLVTYGDIARLTQATQKGNKKDGGIKQKARTR